MPPSGWGTPVRSTPADLDLARRLRADLRFAFEESHDPTHEALAGLAASLAMIGIAAHGASTQGLWGRPRICAIDECGWAHDDHSNDRPCQWCEHGCGNRLRTRAHRARKRTAGAG